MVYGLVNRLMLSRVPYMNLNIVNRMCMWTVKTSNSKLFVRCIGWMLF